MTAGSADSLALPHGRTAARTLALCFAAALAEGYDVGSIGLAAPKMAPALALSRAQLGPVFSASVVGLLIGAVVLGRLADRVGRKRCLIGSMIMFGVFSAATAFCGGFGDLLVIRFLAGLGLGGALPNLIALTAEVASERRRERLVSAMASGMPFGGAIAAAIAAALGWREIFYVGGVFPVVLAAVMIGALPESRRFLSATRSPAVATARTDLGHVLFGGGRAGTTLLLWAASFTSVLTLYLLLNWLPILMVGKGVSQPVASMVALLFGLGGGLGVFIVGSLLGAPHRTLTMAIWFTAEAGALVALARVGADPFLVAASGFAVGAFAGCAPLALYSLAPGYYDVVMRGSGVGASVGIGRLGGIAGPMLAAALLAGGAGSSLVLLALLPIVAVTGAAFVMLLPRPVVGD